MGFACAGCKKPNEINEEFKEIQANQMKIMVLSTSEALEVYDRLDGKLILPTKEEYDTYNRYQRFERQFPFGRMIVSSFNYRIKQSMALENAEYWEKVHHIKLENMRDGFKGLKRWNSLGKPNSLLVKFLTAVTNCHND